MAGVFLVLGQKCSFFFVLNFGGGEISWQAEYRVLQ
nr:MAG TPA: hypothetical protein [Caudoviricetes sp.]